MHKQTVVVIFGGASSEHEVSRNSATTIINALNRNLYEVITLGITKEGKWMIYTGSTEHIPTGEWEKYALPAILSPDATHKAILKLVGNQIKEIPVDVAIPVLHGKYGEDGTIQGLFEMAQIPYVGCGVLSSAACMDKAHTNLLAKNARIAQADYLAFTKENGFSMKKYIKKVESKLGYPCFVKPANAGSSVGISKASNGEELATAIELALEHDHKFLVEKAIVGRELECSVLGNEKPVVSCAGEILAAAEFYDYDAKYNNNESKTVIPADIPEDVTKEMQRMAKKIYLALDCQGLARVDFFLEDGTNRLLFNEINTMPGFTSISMYPKLWEAVGLPLPKLLEELIGLALTRR